MLLNQDRPAEIGEDAGILLSGAKGLARSLLRSSSIDTAPGGEMTEPGGGPNGVRRARILGGDSPSAPAMQDLPAPFLSTMHRGRGRRSSSPMPEVWRGWNVSATWRPLGDDEPDNGPVALETIAGTENRMPTGRGQRTTIRRPCPARSNTDRRIGSLTRAVGTQAVRTERGFASSCRTGKEPGDIGDSRGRSRGAE